MSSRLAAFVLAIAVSSIVATSAVKAQTPAQWRAEQLDASRQSEAIMKDADSHKNLLAQYLVMRGAYLRGKGNAFHLIFGQYFSWYQTFIGDYPAAAASFSISQPPASGDRPSPLSDDAYVARPAIEAIPELAKNVRAVFFNEAHNVVLTRSLTVPILARLRQEGFNYFAAETLYQTDIKKLRDRGYPIRASGFYTREPVCAEMVRTALKLGFKVVAYEALSDATGDAREKEQAHNLYREVFAKDPKARLVVDAGYAHITESGKYLRGSSMAEHLHEITGINPLTIEQTMLIPHPQSHDDHPYYTAVMEKLKPQQPTVFVDQKGRPWSLRPGYDVSVFFPVQHLRRGRPPWLTLGGLRQLYTVDAGSCRQDFPCLAEARYIGEGADAIPADRLLLDPVRMNSESSHRFNAPKTDSTGDLYLRPGEYNLRFVDSDDRVISRQQITVKGPTSLADRSNTANTESGKKKLPLRSGKDLARRDARPAKHMQTVIQRYTPGMCQSHGIPCNDAQFHRTMRSGMQ